MTPPQGHRLQPANETAEQLDAEVIPSERLLAGQAASART
jgi:hypothetical protein